MVTPHEFLECEANAEPDFYFRSWSGIPSNQSSINPIKLLIDDNKTITANFSKIIGTEFMNNFIVTLLIIMPLFFVNVVWLAKRRSKIYSIHHYTMLLITLALGMIIAILADNIPLIPYESYSYFVDQGIALLVLVLLGVLFTIIPAYPTLYPPKKYFEKRGPQNAVLEYDLLKKIAYALFPFAIIGFIALSNLQTYITNLSQINPITLNLMNFLFKDLFIY